MTLVDRRSVLTGLAAAGMAGHGLVHRVIQNFADQVVHGALVGAANIHTGALAHRFQSLEHLDRGGRIAVGADISGGK